MNSTLYRTSRGATLLVTILLAVAFAALVVWAAALVQRPRQRSGSDQARSVQQAQQGAGEESKVVSIADPTTRKASDQTETRLRSEFIAAFAANRWSKPPSSEPMIDSVLVDASTQQAVILVSFRQPTGGLLQLPAVPVPATRQGTSWSIALPGESDYEAAILRLPDSLLSPTQKQVYATYVERERALTPPDSRTPAKP